MSSLEILIQPFYLIIKNLFELGFNILNNYGLAILFLSFSVSLILLPIFIFIEKSKRKNDAIKRKMKPVMDEIKRVYKGQERYYYLKTLYRQHGYSTFKSLIPVLSLLLQIPFFIAAYRFLENLSSLEGSSFGIISDLSKPDGLLFGLNVLPFLMTIINLISAYFYTRYSDPSERNQSYFFAAIFLILLYNFPSGLVLYWTTNNVFSFLRLFITNRASFSNPPQIGSITSRFLFEFKNELKNKRSRFITLFYVILVFSIGSQLQWSFLHDFNQIYLRIIISVLLSIATILILAIISYTSKIADFTNIHSISLFLKAYFSAFKRLFLFSLFIFMAIAFNFVQQPIFRNLIHIIFYLAFSSILVSYFILYLKGYIPLIPEILIQPIKNRFFLHTTLLLAIISVGSQVLWAINHSFEYILFRVSLSLVVSYFMIFCLYYLYEWIKQDIDKSTFSFNKNLKLQKDDIFLFIILLFITILSQLYWATKHNYFSDFLLRVVLSIFISIIGTLTLSYIKQIIKIILGKIKFDIHIKTSYAFIFLTLYLWVSGLWSFGGENINAIALSIILVILLQIYLSIIFPHFRAHTKSKMNNVMFFLSKFFLIIQIGALLYAIYLKFSQPNVSLFEYGILSYFIASGLLSSFSHIMGFKKANSSFEKSNNLIVIFIFAVLYLTGFVFFWHPLLVFSSFPQTFIIPAIFILKENSLLFFAAFLALLGIVFIFPKRNRLELTSLAVTLVFLAFYHNTISPIKVGVLQEVKFVNEQALVKPTYVILLEGIFIVLGYHLIKYTLRIKYSLIFWSLLLLNGTVIGQSLSRSIKTERFFKLPNISENQSHSISFSKDKPNIVYFILDMFHGYYINRMIKEDPDFKQKFSGFTWYSNTISISELTASSLPSILGGYDYTPEKLNEDDNHTLTEKITTITTNFRDKILSKGFRFTSTNLIYSKIDTKTFDSFLPSWHHDWDNYNPQLKIKKNLETSSTVLWQNSLLFSAPFGLKSKIYNNSQWLIPISGDNVNTENTFRHNFLRLLPFISDTNSQKPSFILIHSMATHHPWSIVDDNGVYHHNVLVYENNRWAMKQFSRWIEWMKKNDVYDNTKIVLLSDHGPHWGFSPHKGKNDFNMPFVKNDKIPHRDYAIGLFPLLMVKDYNQKEPLKIDNQFMSNADAYYIAFNEKNPTMDSLKRTRTIRSTITLWDDQIWNQKKFRVLVQFLVTDSAYNQNYWQYVE